MGDLCGVKNQCFIVTRSVI